MSEREMVERIKRLRGLILEIVEEAGSKEGFVELFSAIIDETDTPYLPDSISDPIFKAALPSVYDFMLRFSTLKETDNA